MGCYIYLSWSVTARMLPPRTGSPCYNISTCQNGSKSSTRGMNFPYISELVLDSSAVTAKFCVAPRPHVTTLPSAKIAAKALWVECISRTFLSWLWTAVLSPPMSGWPHVTMLPLAKVAAKAQAAAWICWTFRSSSIIAVWSPPMSWSPQVATLRSSKIAAKAVWVAWTERFGADLQLWRCHRLYVNGPMLPRFHLPKLQQKKTLWRQSAEHSWSGPGQLHCHHHGIHYPMLQSGHLQLQHTTMQMHAMLQLPLAAVQRHKCCPHLPSTFQRFAWIQ